MGQKEYNKKTNDPCAFRKNVLKETLEVLKVHSAPEAVLIEQALKTGGIEKPIMHQRPDGYDYYWIRSTAEQAEAIASYLFEAEYTAAPTSGDITPKASKYANIVDIWINFRDWIERGGIV